MMNSPVSKTLLFETLCKDDIYCTNLFCCLPSTYLSNHFNTSRYQVLKAVKALKKEGLVTSICHNVYDWYSERYLLVRGFTVTDKARNTEIYKKIDEDYMNYLASMCNGGIE